MTQYNILNKNLDFIQKVMEIDMIEQYKYDLLWSLKIIEYPSYKHLLDMIKNITNNNHMHNNSIFNKLNMIIESTKDHCLNIKIKMINNIINKQ